MWKLATLPGRKELSSTYKKPSSRVPHGWLIFAPSLHAGNFMCPTGFYNSSLVGQCHMLQHNWPLINLFHTPFWWPPKLLPQNLPRCLYLWIYHQQPLKQKNGGIFVKKKVCQSPICKKASTFFWCHVFDSSQEKNQRSSRCVTWRQEFMDLGIFKKVEALGSLLILETWKWYVCMEYRYII